MKTILLISLILAATAMTSTAAQSSVTTGMDSTISQMKQDLQTQVERIRRARETASTQMTLARIRIAEQLRRSEEDLSRQIESLERFREQMADQKGQTDQAVVLMQKDWKQFIQQAFSDLDSQLRDTNSLITQMETLRDRFDVEPDELGDTQQEGQTMTPSAPQPMAPTITVTTPTATEPVTTPVVQTSPASTEPATTTPTVTSITPTSTGST
ncbi:MAG: hypothetical protein ACLP5H_16945 [Desulfomonilaceae bacterium]